MEHHFIVQNLKCGGCGHSIKKGLQSIVGVRNVSVIPDTSEVNFETQSDQILGQVKEKLKEMGYPVMGTANTFRDKAISFVSCSKGKFGGSM